MKIELSDINGYHTYGYFEPVNHPDGYYSLKITSRWETAKNSEDEQTRFTMLLSPDSVNNLRKLIK